MAAGCMSLIGAGPGFRTMTGAGLRITMGAGCMLTEAGVGGLGRLTDTRSTVRFGRLLMFRSSVGAVGSDSDSVGGGARSAGCPWDRATISIPGGAGGADASARAALARSTAAVLLRCTGARDFRT